MEKALHNKIANWDLYSCIEKSNW